MALASKGTSKGLPAKHMNLSKTSLDSHDACTQTLGEDLGLGKILLGLRYVAARSSMEVRIVKAEGVRVSGATEAGAAKPSTYCSATFLPDRTEPVVTATVESSDCPRWRGAFRFEKFPSIAATGNQRCLQVQVHEAATGSAISEVTMLLSNWSQAEFEKGIATWKYLNGTRETQRVSCKEGSVFMTLFCKPDRLTLTLHRVEDLNVRWTAPNQPPEFQMKLQAVLSGKVVKEAAMQGLRCSAGGEVNFYDDRFNVRLGKRGHGAHCLSLRLVLSRKVDCCMDQELYWLDLGATVRRPDCRNLYDTVLKSPNQAHVVCVPLNKPPVVPLSEMQVPLNES